ncbi:MAG: PQQ-binding-like beta-propeller repeat protein [Myxococcota bacterium]
MRATPVRWTALVVGLVAGCASVGDGDFDWAREGRLQTGGRLQVQWVERLTPEQEGPYIPVEHATAALHPAADRVYIGSSQGVLHALTASGREVWRYAAGARIWAAPALDRNRGEIYLAAEDGSLHALKKDGTLRWKDSAGDTVSQPPVLAPDVVYVVTDADRVLAFAREDGSLLWDYAREVPEGFSVTTRAGLLLLEEQLITGFTDGAVVSLDPTEGDVLWERDTSMDLDEPTGSQPVFRDVDTTPVLANGTLYVASFAAGLYALDPRNGSVRWRDGELEGIVGITFDPSRRQLYVASADRGILAVGVPDRQIRWRYPILRGSPSRPVLHRGLVLVGESQGSLLALSADGGKEVSRLEAGTGFNAVPTLAHARGFVLSNGGTLFAFTL